MERFSRFGGLARFDAVRLTLSGSGHTGRRRHQFVGLGIRAGAVLLLGAAITTRLSIDPPKEPPPEAEPVRLAHREQSDNRSGRP